MSTQFYDNQVATVNYQILFTKRDNEAMLKSGTEVVTSAMSGSGFASWRISLFVQELNKRSTTLSGKDGIPKPADWTDDEAIELAVEVFPDVPAVAAAASASVAAAKGAANNPGNVALARNAEAAATAANAAAANAAPDDAAYTAAFKAALEAAKDSLAKAQAYEAAETPANFEAAAIAAYNAFVKASAAAGLRLAVQRIIGLKPENLKYLQVDYQVISTLDRKPPRYDSDQIDALRDIASAIKGKT